MRKPNPIAPGLSRAKIYWTYGSAPRESQTQSCVNDPPTSGWAVVLVVGELDAKGSQLVFCPYSFRSFNLLARSHEMASLQGSIDAKSDGEIAATYCEMLPRKWAEVARHGQGNPDFKTAHIVFDALGIEPPSIDQIKRSEASAPSKAAAPKAPEAKPQSAFKPVKPSGRKADILRKVLEAENATLSILACCDEWGISRSNFLSQSHALRKGHGLDYSINDDSIVFTLPDGVTEFWTK